MKLVAICVGGTKLVAICVGGTKFSQKHIKVINIFHFILFYLLSVCVFVFFTPNKVYPFPNNYGVKMLASNCMLPTIHSWIQNLVKYQDVKLRHKNFSVQN